VLMILYVAPVNLDTRGHRRYKRASVTITINCGEL